MGQAWAEPAETLTSGGGARPRLRGSGPTPWRVGRGSRHPLPLRKGRLGFRAGNVEKWARSLYPWGGAFLPAKRKRLGPQGRKVRVLRSKDPEPRGQGCPCFLGDRARLRPPPGLDPPRSRAHASRSQAPPRRFPWLRRIRAFGGNPQGRPLDPQELWWLSWGSGLGGGTLCVHAHAHALSGNERPLPMVASPRPVRDPECLGLTPQAWGGMEEDTSPRTHGTLASVPVLHSLPSAKSQANRRGR